MKNFIRKYLLLIIASLVVICLLISQLTYRSSKTELLDKSGMDAFAQAVITLYDNGYLNSQESVTDFITAWGNETGLKYKKDTAGNIVFISAAAERKKKIAPTIVCVSCNYKTVRENAYLLASAAMIAKTDLDSGRKIVMFVNDELDTGYGYTKLSRKLFTKKPKVIYMDYGDTSYLSNSSFAKKYSTITIDADRDEPVCDTAVKIHISVPYVEEIGSGITKHPDAVGSLSALLTRLKSKSTIYQIADLKVESSGSMTPVSVDATVMLNSYAVSSFTKYMDKRIKAWEKSCGNDYENAEFTYEVIDDPDSLPGKAYSRQSSENLTNVLYTLKSGLYKYDSDDTIPDGKESGDICGINYILGLNASKDSFSIDLMTQAYDEDCMTRISDDNTACAVLFDAGIEDTDSADRFLNEKDSLYRTFRNTYFKINSVLSTTDVLSDESDDCFTPCSYLAKKNKNADVVHLRLNSSQAHKLTNTILCYIAFKGNFLF